MTVPAELKLVAVATLAAFLIYPHGELPAVALWFGIVGAYVFGRVAGEGNLREARQETAAYWQAEVNTLKQEIQQWKDEVERLNP